MNMQWIPLFVYYKFWSIKFLYLFIWRKKTVICSIMHQKMLHLIISRSFLMISMASIEKKTFYSAFKLTSFFFFFDMPSKCKRKFQSVHLNYIVSKKKFECLNLGLTMKFIGFIKIYGIKFRSWYSEISKPITVHSLYSWWTWLIIKQQSDVID